MTRIVCISDTHNRIGKIQIPEGDILVHAGDGTMMGRPEEVGKFAAYLECLPHKHKIVIAGNHDWLFEKDPDHARAILADAGVTYLQDSEVTVEGLRFYGAPWQPRFHDWAFNLDRGDAIRAKWDLIPAGLDFLITHGPPWDILDSVAGEDEPLGCEDLRNAVIDKMPKYHVFGHIHSGHGRVKHGSTVYINASICDESYQPTQAPVVVDVEK